MKYSIKCKRSSVKMNLHNNPIVQAYCHCEDCRELLNIPFHAVTAWKKEDVTFQFGEDVITIYQHPSLKMQKHFCSTCGEVMFNTNGMDWRVVSQHLIAKCYNNKLPESLASDKHFFYEQRVADINDLLPKYLRGTSGPLFTE